MIIVTTVVVQSGAAANTRPQLSWFYRDLGLGNVLAVGQLLCMHRTRFRFSTSFPIRTFGERVKFVTFSSTMIADRRLATRMTSITQVVAFASVGVVPFSFVTSETRFMKESQNRLRGSRRGHQGDLSKSAIFLRGHRGKGSPSISRGCKHSPKFQPNTTYRTP